MRIIEFDQDRIEFDGLNRIRPEGVEFDQDVQGPKSEILEIGKVYKYITYSRISANPFMQHFRA